MSRHVCSTLWVMAAGTLLLTTCGISPSSATMARSLSGQSASSPTRTFKDMAGRTVTLPTNIQRIADTGATPVVNTLLFLLGAGSKIVNNLPTALQKPDFHFQYVFDPALATDPTVEGNIGSINTELLATVKPQVVFTDLPFEVAPLTAAGFTVFVVTWNSFKQLESAVTLMGQVLQQPARARSFNRYLDATISKVHADIAAIPASKQPTVAYLQYTPLGIADGSLGHYWLPLVGAKDVTFSGDISGSDSLGAEKLVELNPQVIITQARSDSYSFEHDPRFASVAAIKDHRVYVEPAGAQHWGNETTETPLIILWAAKLLHPAQTKNINVSAATKAFYKTFYGTVLSSQQVSEVIGASFEGTQVP